MDFLNSLPDLLDSLLDNHLDYQSGRLTNYLSENPEISQ